MAVDLCKTSDYFLALGMAIAFNVGMLRWPSRESFKAYLLVSLQLSLVFVSVYGVCNWYATQVSSRAYRLWMDWELSIPLIPSMIVVYVSLNVLTGLPLFTLSAEKIYKLGKAMIVATIVAGAFFLLIPAPLGYTRTTDVGIWQRAFEILFSLDQVANTVPSLHITYSFLTVRTITAADFRWNIHLWVWFAGICASVLLVRQHHVIDIVAGLTLAEVCYRKFVIPDKVPSESLVVDRQGSFQ